MPHAKGSARASDFGAIALIPRGQGFSGSAAMFWIGENAPGPVGISNPIPFGSGAGFSFGAGGNDTGMSLSVDGVSSCSTDTNVAGATGSYGGGAAGPIAHAGIYSGSVSFDAHLYPNVSPSPPACSLGIYGSGTALFDVLEIHNPDLNPPMFYIDSVTVTFKAPEPSTTSLLLIAFAGLAVMDRRRRPRARNLN